MLRTFAIVISLLGLSACGGGGGGSSSVPPTENCTAGAACTMPTGWVQGVFPTSSSAAQKCASPRSGVDPVTHVAYRDVQGTTTDENNFLRSWTHELYLWYSEVPDLNPANYSTTAEYFPLLKTSATTPSGAPKDKFHFTYDTTIWEQLSQSGVSVGYGAIFTLPQPSPPRRILVAYVQPASSSQPSNPALTAGLVRGDAILQIDGVDAVNATGAANLATLNEGLNPTKAATHTFVVQDPGASGTRTVPMAAQPVNETTVPVVAKLPLNNTQVGYMLFNDQLATSEKELISAVNSLQGVADLFLDLRYNGGGYLDIASELAYMIAGSGKTGGGSSTFEQIEFNSQYPGTDPVSGRSTTTLFHATTQNFSVPSGQALPSLNLSRVFVLTSEDTCSASEAIMNGLRGVGVQVIQVGSTTCGKPYGFYPQENCGTTYFSIEFQGVNALGQGGYSDGFTPANQPSGPGTIIGVPLPGCSVADDLAHALGDPNEGLLQVALAYSTNPSCSVPPSGSSLASLKRATRAGLEVHVRSPLREMRILRP
jgi:carboxyl-terminal processing protease